MKPKLAFAFITSILFAFLFFLAPRVFTQTTAVRSLITGPVDESRLTTLHGNVHPLARAQFDRGVAADNLPMDHMLLVLKRSQAQETALETLMAQQLDKSSPNYHKWLTPQQFGEQFGPSDQDIQKITAWLESHGFTIDNVSNGHTTIEFSGDAAQVQSAFHTPIHSYVINNEQHWANAQDPSIPTALVPAVAGVRSLHNFYPKPLSRIRGPFRRAQVASQGKPRANYTFGSSGACSFVQYIQELEGFNITQACYVVAPGDFAEIYGTQPVVTNQSLDGTGVTIAIVSDSGINTTDASTFRQIWNLPAQNLTVPATQVAKNSDETEAILDVEWSGAVALGANIDLVENASTNSTFGGDISAVDIVDNKLGQILSYSYGACEESLTGQYTVPGAAGSPFSSANAFYNMTWQAAAAEGITVLVASGDNGSAGCDNFVAGGSGTQVAKGGLQVNGIASTPYNTAVGGTDFNDLSNPANYWGSGFNNTITLGTSNTQASASGYIPETTWNESCTNSVFVSLGVDPDAENACNDPSLNSEALLYSGNLQSVQVTVGGSGGASSIYSKPCWQGGPTSASCPQTSGVTTPNDNARDLPDVSLFAGDGTISGSFYYLCQSDLNSGGAECLPLSNPEVEVSGAGGTSAAVQSFAGIMALIVQKDGAQGNINPNLYSLAAGAHGSAIFNQITSGTNAMPCEKGSPDCVVSAQVVSPLAHRGKPANWLVPVALTLLCVFCLGSILAAFAGRPRRWGVATACVALALLVVTAACGGGSNSNSGPPPSQDFTIGILTRYNASAGYNLTNGNGSVNVNNLVEFWP